jgi:CubicO group peptidase (beta-lactamase class C family)
VTVPALPTFQLSGRRIASAVLAIALLSLGCASARRPSASLGIPGCPSLEPVYPAAAWERIERPECAGWSSAGLDAVRQKLSTMHTTGLVAIVGGRVLMDYGDVQLISYLASVRKSVLSMLYGIYVERGVIDLDKTLAQLGIDDLGGLTEQEKQATTRHLLMARSGVYHAASNSGDDLASAPPRGSQKPGEYYLYSNWDFNALGTIFEQETGKNIYDALEEHLARPLGMQEFDRSMHRRTGDSTRSVHLAYHMHLSTRDMARIGYLMLREGRWEGRQIVPRAWVRESTRALTSVHEMNPPQRRNGVFGYGYLWWVFDRPDRLGPAYDGAFTGLGAVGQHILVMPNLDLVVAHKTEPGRGGSVPHSQFLEVLELLVKAHCGVECPVATTARVYSRAKRPLRRVLRRARVQRVGVRGFGLASAQPTSGSVVIPRSAFCRSTMRATSARSCFAS